MGYDRAVKQSLINVPDGISTISHRFRRTPYSVSIQKKGWLKLALVTDLTTFFLLFGLYGVQFDTMVLVGLTDYCAVPWIPTPARFETQPMYTWHCKTLFIGHMGNTIATANDRQRELPGFAISGYGIRSGVFRARASFETTFSIGSFGAFLIYLITHACLRGQLCFVTEKRLRTQVPTSSPPLREGQTTTVH